MVRLERSSNSPEQTRLVGLSLGRVLRAGAGGEGVALLGPMGAGKTTLVRAIAEGLGIDPAAVSSPTFVIVNEYAAPDGLVLVHADACRVRAPEELAEIGWDRLVGAERGPGVVFAVEWADRIAGELPDEARTARVAIQPTGAERRRFVLDIPEAWLNRPGASELGSVVPPAASASLAPTRCPVTGVPVPPDCPTYPFASERARRADLYAWMCGAYAVPGAAARDEPPAADD